MTDPTTGTTESKPDGGAAGTQAGGTDGGEKGGRTPTPDDLKALAETHQKNLTTERKKVQELETRLQQLQTQIQSVASAPPASPREQRMQNLQERMAFGDQDAAILYEQELRIQRSEIEQNVSDAITDAKVAPELVTTVKRLIRNSNYSMPLADAVKMARGTAIDTVEEKAKSLAEENESLKKRLAAEESKVRVPNMSTYPAAPSLDTASIAGSEYNAILARGGPEAKALYDRAHSPRGSAGHIELDLSK